MFDPQLANRVVRNEWSKLVSTATRILGDLDLAEDAAQEALLSATRSWPIDGIPNNPGAWLTTVTKRRALNILRSRKRRSETELSPHLTIDNGLIESSDDRLKLYLLCCHPSLSHDARVSLTLRLAGGLSTREIARAFLTEEKTIGQRISRAKAKLRQVPDLISNGRVPVNERLNAVYEVLYAVFNEGYLSHKPYHPIRKELIGEAMMLAQQITDLVPDSAEANGLTSLMFFKAARVDARLALDGQLVSLDEQNRSRWNRSLISQAEVFRSNALNAGSSGSVVGTYTLQADIEFYHCRAEKFEDVQWGKIDALYEILVGLTGNPVAELSWVVARSYAVSIDAALELLDVLGTEARLGNYRLAKATRADLLRRSGDVNQARYLYEKLLGNAPDNQQTRFFQRRLRELRS